MIAKYLWIISSLNILVLGSVQLFYTFFTTKLSPRSEMLENEMKATSPKLSKQTTLWKAWKGFNGSHSIGIIFIGLINFYLAFKHFAILKYDNLFFIFNILTIGFYIFLARKYWFKLPLIGFVITLIGYLASYITAIIDR